MNNILEIILWSILPISELRGSIPIGILKLNMNWLPVFIIAVIANSIMGLIAYSLIKYIIIIGTKIKWIGSIYQKYVDRTQKKINPLVDKYGEWALAIFIGIPLPMTGAYSGALAAHIIGLKYRKFVVANFVGVLIAGIIVTIIVLSGITAFNIFLKKGI